MPIDPTIYQGYGQRRTESVPFSEKVNRIQTAQAYSRTTQLQADKAERELEEAQAIDEALAEATDANGKIDEERVVLMVAQRAPAAALRLKGEFDDKRAKEQQAELAWAKLTAQQKSAHLSQTKDKMDFLGTQARSVLALPDDRQDDAYNAMRQDVFNAIGEELPALRDNDNLKRLVAASSEYDSWHKVEEKKVAESRLLEFKAALPGFKELAIQAARDPKKKAELMSVVLSQFADVPEARAYATGTPTKEEVKIASPGVQETIRQHDIDNVFKASRDFQDDPSTKRMITITDANAPVKTQWEDYLKDPTPAKRQFVEQQLIVAFAKIADPSSVVMPGEFKRTVLGQTWFAKIYNKLKAGTSVAGLGLSQAQLQTIYNYNRTAEAEAIKMSQPGYELFKERVKVFDPSAVERETKRYHQYFNPQKKETTANKTGFEDFTDDQLEKRRQELLEKRGGK